MLRLSASYEKAKTWLLSSGLFVSNKDDQNCGGVYSFYDEKKNEFCFLYPEITGYFLSTLRFLYEIEKNQKYVEYSKLSASWLVKIYDKYGGIIQGFDSGSSKKELAFSFDTAVCAKGLLDGFVITNEKKYLEYAKKIVYYLIDETLENDGTIKPYKNLKKNQFEESSEVWYKQKGCLHIKTAIPLLHLYEITKDRNLFEKGVKILDSFSQYKNADGSFKLHQNNEIINLHRANIVKYQDKGPTDILNFIKQIEAEVSVHNKNLKEAMEELASYYDGLSDSTINEVSGLIRQVQESGDKLTAITNDSLQIITNTTAKTSESVDTYFSESITNLENQIAVTTGFVTSEVETAAEIVKNEVEVLKSEMKQTVKGLNAEIKDFVTHQDQEFQTKIPELSEKFKQVFDEVIQERTELDKELQVNIENDLDKLMNNWSKEIQKAKSTLEGVSKAVDGAIESNLEKFDVIVNTNVEQAIKRIKVIFKFDSSKEDIFGLREIQSKVKQSNKRLKSVISETLQEHIEKFEEKIPEFVTSFEAIHNQTEEDLASHIEDLRDLISSSQTSLTNQIHEYIKGERENIDFTEMKAELKEIVRNFTQSTNQEIELLSVDLADSIKTSITTIDISREEIMTLLQDISPKLMDQDTVLLDNLIKFKENAVKSIEELSSNTKKDLVNSLETYNNDLDKGTFDMTAESTHLVQSLTEEFEKQIDEFQTSSNDLLDQLMTTNTLQKESLQELAKIVSSTKPEYAIRVVNLPTNDARNEYINDMIKGASKQVTIFASNPTFLSPEDLKSIPSEKRIWIYSSYDFTKKGKKWLSEVGGQVNVNLRKANTKKISGVILVQDNNSALILPDALGYISLDSKFISYLSELLNLLKGPSLRRIAKKG